MTRTNKFNVLLVVRSSGRHSLDEELAGTFHFYALLDVNGLFGFRDSVTHHPCGGASCRGAGSGVFTIRVDRSGAKAHAGITSVPGDIVEASVVPLAFQVGIHFAQIETQGLQSAKLLERHDGERQAGGDGLNGPLVGNVARLQIEKGGYRVSIVHRSEHRWHLAHFSEDAAGRNFAKADRHFSYFQVEGNLRDIFRLGCARFVPGQTKVSKHHGGAQCWVTTKGDLLFGNKNPHLYAMFSLRCSILRKDERCLLEIRFARKVLHLCVAQAAGIGEDGKWVPLQSPRCEYVNLHRVKTPEALFRTSTLGGVPGVYERRRNPGSADSLQKAATVSLHSCADPPKLAHSTSGAVARSLNKPTVPRQSKDMRDLDILANLSSNGTPGRDSHAR